MDYKSKRWKRLRERILRRDDYMCQVSKRYGRRVEANTVHHIYPADEYPEYQWKDWNLISLSAEAHNAMHDRNTNELTAAGEALRRETGMAQGQEGKRTILVIGNPGAGKTTYVKQRLRNGIVYDLDAIAGALRLRSAKSELYKPARWLANDLLPGFTEAAHRYVDIVWIIRTAPSLDEFNLIDPTKLVVIHGNYGNEELTAKRRHKISEKIKKCLDYAYGLGIEVEEIETETPRPSSFDA